MTNVLECSSKGDKRYSAFYARVKIFGKEDSIENHYQLAKRIGDFIPRTWKDVKGKKPTHICINSKDYPLKYTIAFYELMWLKYLDENPKLVEYAKLYDDYSDMFKSKNAVVCQADVIRDYVKLGRKYIIDKHWKFIELLLEDSDSEILFK